MAQWIARMPTEHEVDGSTPSVVVYCFVSRSDNAQLMAQLYLCSLAVHMVECPLLLLESLLYAHCVYFHLAKLPLSRFYRLVGVRVLFLAHIAALWRFAFPSDTRKAKRLSQAGNMTLYKGTLNHCRSVFTRARLTSGIVRGRMKS